MRPEVLEFRVLRWALLALGLGTLSACAQQGPKLQLNPDTMHEGVFTAGLPIDPFATESESSPYARLRAETDAARAVAWNGELDSFGPWLQMQTQSIEEALGALAELRTGRPDQYGVASGRLALAYEHVARNVDRAGELAEAAAIQADWKDLSPVLWERAQSCWTRCAKVTAAGAPHLDAWKMRCAEGVRSSSEPPARQAK
jgi:hypothetical protein